jgi:peptide/nickel transport system permease protein
VTFNSRVTVPLCLLLAIHLAALTGGFLSPNSPIAQDRNQPWAPPSDLRFFDDAGRFHFRPFIYSIHQPKTEPKTHTPDSGDLLALRFFVRGDHYRFLGLFRTNLHFVGVDPPGRLYLLGTDESGRDVFARTLVGGRTSLFAGLSAATLALGIGTLVGGISGYCGGRTDAALMRLAELFLSLPWLYLLLALRAFLPIKLSPIVAFSILVLLIGLIGWALPARLVRGVVLSAKQRPFVTASRGFGAKHQHLLRAHVLPQALPLVATQAAIAVPTYILAEVTLSFLDLGISQPHPSWGNQLASLQSYHVLASNQWMLMPVIPLILTFACYYALNTSRRSNLR